jgi:hypothetical protein
MCNSSRMNLRRTSSVFSAAGGSTVSSEMFSKIRLYFIDRVCCERKDSCGIIARFVYFKDKETVLKAARTSLRDKPQKIYSQFPQEIDNRRRELVPIMKDFIPRGFLSRRTFSLCTF